MTEAIVVRGSAEPQTMAELKDFAAMAAGSQFFGVANAEQALVLAMAGKDLGFSYTQALRAFHIVKGKPTLSADGMVAACLGRPELCEYFRPVRVTETEAVWVTKPKGAEPIEYRFTMEDARKAGLVNAMYEKHPKRMLSARCKAYLARDVYPQVLMGLVTEDEAEEIATSRVVQAVQVQVEESPVGPLVARIEAATTVAELESVAVDIKRAKVGEWDLDKLRRLYATRMDALTPPAAALPAAATPPVVDAVVEPVAVPTREPGEEG